MKIGIDIDSTLNTLDHEWSQWIIKNHDWSFTLDKWTDWNIGNLSKAGNKVYNYLHLPGAFRNSGVRPLAGIALFELHNAGHELVIVTSCDPASSYVEKYDWVRHNFVFIPKKNIIASSRKGLLKLDVLIDDGPHNFEGFDGRTIIFDQPWNRQYGGERMYGWDKLPTGLL